MSFMLLGILNAQGGVGIEYWLASIGDSNSQESQYASAIDSAGNVYTTSADYGCIKVSPAGEIVFQKKITGLGSNYGMFANDSYGVLQSGTIFGSKPGSPGGWELNAALRNLDGVLQWQRYIGTAGNDVGYGCAIDSSGNMYFAGEGNGAPAQGGAIIKLTSGGALSWSKTLVSGAGKQTRANEVEVAASGNIYWVGNNNFASSSLRIQVAKFDSSGNLQWQRFIGSGSTQTSANALCIDSSENIYVVGETYESSYGSSDAFIAKYNSGGSLSWQRQIGGSGNDIFSDVALDQDENVYAMGKASSLSSNQMFVAKYNASGTLQFQRTMQGAFSGRPQIQTFENGVMNWMGTIADSSGSNNNFVAKLPTDGSLTGTYTLDSQTLVYSASGLSNKTSSISSGTSSQSIYSGGWSAGATSDTDGTTTFPIAKVTI